VGKGGIAGEDGMSQAWAEATPHTLGPKVLQSAGIGAYQVLEGVLEGDGVQPGVKVHRIPCAGSHLSWRMWKPFQVLKQ
jgi:hypothetical protein